MDDEFIPNYRWLPILSGVTIPFAILLQIPGLTERWYVRTDDNRTIDSRPNPSTLLAANILAMAAALIANICLIVRFLEKRVKQMTVIALCLLSIHDVINTVTVTVFGVEHRFDDGFTYGQPFWLVVASTVVSLFTTITLIWDLWTTPDFSKSGSGLTRKQRSLVIIVMILLCWIAFGGLVYSILMHLSFIDGLYFTVVSIETIGFGDLHPNSTGSRIFAVIYNSIGILNIGLAISTARETIIESFEHSYRRRAREVAARRSEYKKLKAHERARKMAIERTLREAGHPLYVPDALRSTRMKLNEEALTPGQLAAALQEATRLVNRRAHGVGDSAAGVGRAGPGFDRTLSFERTLSLDLNMKEDYHGYSYEENYKNFRLAILREEKREFAAKLTVAWLIFLTFWLIGAGIFSQTEKWTYGNSLYFCFVAFSTIGYGDFSPVTPAGRSVFVVWALMGVGAMTILISVLSEAYSSRYKNVLSKGSFERAVKNFRERRSTSPPPHITRSRLRSRSQSRDASPERPYTRENAKRELEALPSKLLNHAKTFHEHIHYFLSSTNGSDPPPQTLHKLLDEIAESEHMDARLKQEVLGDDGARKTLFMMSYEGALRKMIDTAEKAVALLARRDLVGHDHNGSTDGSTTQVQDSDVTIVTVPKPSYQSHDRRVLPLNFDSQRYMRRTTHMHPQGLVSEPNLSSPTRNSSQ
ncbi:voltage-gated potassium channel [Ramaria rubella]|nr:voltage-gated potassium channel [Ramaria rubella]